MAVYEYHCVACGHEFSRMERLSEHGRAKVTCPKCRSAKVEQVPAAFFAKTVRKS